MLNHCRDVEPALLCKDPERLGHSVQTAKTGGSLNVEGKIVLLGVPDDRGVSFCKGFKGAAAGPQALRRAFYNLYDDPWQSLGELITDAGDIQIDRRASNQHTHARLAETVQTLLKNKAEIVLILGGGHDLSFGSYQGHAQGIGAKTLPLINLDAHLELREQPDSTQMSSGSPHRRILEDPELSSLVEGGALLKQVGIQRALNAPSMYKYAEAKGITLIEYQGDKKLWFKVGKQGTEMHHAKPTSLQQIYAEELKTFEEGPVHLTLDCSLISTQICPATSAGTPHGTDLEQTTFLLNPLLKNRACRVLDVVELCPPRDTHEQSMRLVARILFDALKERLYPVAGEIGQTTVAQHAV